MVNEVARDDGNNHVNSNNNCYDEEELLMAWKKRHSGALRYSTAKNRHCNSIQLSFKQWQTEQIWLKQNWMAKGIFLHFTNDTYLFYLRWHFAGILSIESGDGWCNIFGVTQAIGIIAKIFNSIIIIVPCQPMLLAPLFFVTQQPNVLIRKNTIVICSFPIGCIWLCLFASHFFSV